MKLVKLTGIGRYDLYDICTEIVERSNGKKHHNIKFGSRDRGLWRVSLGVDNKMINVDNDPLPVWLNKDNYSLIPLLSKDDGKQRLDARGNPMYFISFIKNPTEAEKNDVLAFIEIPNVFYRNITFEIEGGAKLISVGYNGQTINGVTYSSPCPIVLIKDGMVLKWKGFDKDNNIVTQTISYINNKVMSTDITHQ